MLQLEDGTDIDDGYVSAVCEVTYPHPASHRFLPFAI
jgi:hypothetical protein